MPLSNILDFWLETSLVSVIIGRLFYIKLMDETYFSYSLLNLKVILNRKKCIFFLLISYGFIWRRLIIFISRFSHCLIPRSSRLSDYLMASIRFRSKIVIFQATTCETKIIYFQWKVFFFFFNRGIPDLLGRPRGVATPPPRGAHNSHTLFLVD